MFVGMQNFMVVSEKHLRE